MKCTVIVPRVPASELLNARMPMVDETLGYELGVCRWGVRSASDEGAELVLQPNGSLLIPTGVSAAILAAMRTATETTLDLVRDELSRAWVESEEGRLLHEALRADEPPRRTCIYPDTCAEEPAVRLAGVHWVEDSLLDGLYDVSSGTRWAPCAVSAVMVRWIHTDEVHDGHRWLRPLPGVA